MNGTRRTAEQRQKRQAVRVAVHEAGHAVIAADLGVPFQYVTVEPDGEALGHLLHEDPPRDGDTFRWLEDRVRVAWAGSLAERRLTGRMNWVAARSDLAQVQNLVALYTSGSEETAAFMKWLRIATDARVQSRWKWVEDVAVALVNRGPSLTADEVLRLDPVRELLEVWARLPGPSA